MGKGAPLRWIENRYLRRHLRGRGLEIGALWRRFPVPPRARVWIVDRFSPAELAGQHGNRYDRIVPPDLVAEATQLPLPPHSVDFIIASHVLEHLPFPLAALRTWYEALAPGGALLLRVPDKRYSMDVRRARTSLAHLIEEYEHPERFDRRAHYADWLEYVRGQPPGQPEFEPMLREAMTAGRDIHFHVWIDEDVGEIIDFTRQVWRLGWQPAVFWNAHFYRKESVALLRKEAAAG